MKTAIILHGTLGSPNGNWFGWLKNQLQQRGFTVWLPQLPQAEKPSLSMWQQFVKDQCPFAINEDTLIIGHSSGAILAMVLAQNNAEKIGAVVAVSAFHDNSLQWEPNDQLFDVSFDWGAIRASVNELLFIHSDNDPYVPLDQAQYVADKCQAELLVIPDQGHFNLEQSEAYKEFPKLIEAMELRTFLHLNLFNFDGTNRKVKYIETVHVKDGVKCDTYSFVDDDSQDLAIIRVASGHATPRQKVLKGIKTLEGFVWGEGDFRIEHADGTEKVFKTLAPHFPVISVRINEIMQWHASGKSSLVFYEICQPSYEDG